MTDSIPTAYIDASGSTTTNPFFRTLAKSLQDSGWLVYEFSDEVRVFDRDAGPASGPTRIDKVVEHIIHTDPTRHVTFVFTDDDGADKSPLVATGVTLATVPPPPAAAQPVATPYPAPSLLHKVEEQVKEALQGFCDLGNAKDQEQVRRIGIGIIRAADRALHEANWISPSVPNSLLGDLNTLIEQARAVKAKVAREVFQIAST